MIEREEASIQDRLAEGRIGLSPCRYACPGCPASVRPEALQVRLVGGASDLEDRVRDLRPRFVELASGELPADPDRLARWRQAGMRRLLVPIFGVEAEHDRRSGRVGSFDSALKTLQAARLAELETQLLVPAPPSGFDGLARRDFEALRYVMRLGWQHHARIRWFKDPAPPCIAMNPE